MHKHLTITSINDFLPKDTNTLKQYWASELGQQINQLPPLDAVIEELQEMLKNHVDQYLSYTNDER